MQIIVCQNRYSVVSLSHCGARGPDRVESTKTWAIARLSLVLSAPGQTQTPGANPKEGVPAALNDYEIALIIRPEVEEEGQAALIERLSEILTSAGGEVTDVETWGRRRLAYPIRKTQEGFYYFIQGQFSTSVLPELERTIKLNEDILRHMVIRKGD
jgi:small subunit ribosomal protein S6